MKKPSVMIVLALALALFSACAHMTGTGVGEPAAPVLDRILKKGELVVGTAGTMPPLNMTTKEGEIIGLEPDIARYMAKAMDVKIRFEAMPFSELLPALEAGKVDMVLSSMTITPKRNLKAAFVGPYFVSGKSFLTKLQTIGSAKDPGEINSPDTTLAALKGSTSQIFVEKLIPKAKLVTTPNYDDAVEMVLQDKVDALIADFQFCLFSVLRYPDEGLVSLITPLTYEPIGIAVPANDPLLANWVQNFLNTLEGGGALDQLKDRWFKERSWLTKLP